MFKVGDNVISKSNTYLWYEGTGPYDFLYKKSYKIVGHYRTTMAGKIFIIKSENKKVNIIEDNLELYFFNDTELRKLKLEKLANEI